MDDDEIMRQINAGGGGMDVEDELEALEAEIAGEKGKKKKKDGDDLSLSDLSDEEDEKKPAAKQKHDSDDDLAALEKEGLDDEDLDDEEDEKPKQKPKEKNPPKPQPKPQPQQKPPQQQINKQELAKAIQTKQEKNNGGVDLYPEKVEKKYHAVEKMVSLGVLTKEKEICDKILEYKKSRNEDFDAWELKKESIDDKIGMVTSTIQDGIWDFEMYKKKIKEQYAWESKLLFFLEKDPSLNEQQKNILKERINNRKLIIEDELKRNPEEEAEAEEQASSPKEEEKKPTQQEKSLPSNIPTQTAGEEKIDLYPEKVENKYHTVAKMVSLGVLTKEKEICDKILEYKKSRNEDFDTWELKKESIDDKIGIVTSTIQDGIWDFEMYKKKIKEQYAWESKLLLFLEKDPSLNEQQKKVLKERINNRKIIIEEELKRNPEEEAEAEEEKEAVPQKEEINKSSPQEKSDNQKVEEQNIDLYPEKVENKYHTVAKMVSLGVLAKEKEICDNILDYKKKKGEDYDTWEIKKESIDDKVGIVTSTIQDGIWDFEMYKKKIKEQYAWESKLLIFLEKDTSLNEKQKNILKERINNRKLIIEDELKRNPEEEEAEADGEEEKLPEPVPKNIEQKPKKEELSIKKSLNPLYDVPKEKEAEEIKRLTEAVTDRLNEYRAAIDYFKNNELTEQQTNAIKAAKDICIELKKIQDGKWREVNEFKLPDPVTPSYIYGYSNEERDKRFDLIISEYDKQRIKIQDEMDQKIEGHKKSKRPEQKKNEASIKKELDELNTKKKKYEKIVQLLKANKQNKWVPAPIYIQTEEEKRVQVINEDIPENTVRIIFGKTNYVKKKDKVYLKVMIEEKNIEKKINQKSPGDWSTPFDITLDQSSFKSFHTYEIKVEIFVKKHIIKDKYKGKFTMKAKGLKDQIECSADYQIELKKKKKDDKNDYTVSCTFRVQTPCKTPAFEVQKYPIYQITRIYPAFNIRGGNNTETGIKIEVQQQKITSEDLKINNSVQRPPGKAAQTSQRPQKAGPSSSKPKAGGAPPKKPGPPKAIVDKSQFSDEELKDPDCINCLNTLQVLEFKINKYEEIRNKIDGRTPRELMQRIVKMKCKMQNLTNSLGDDISPQDYLALLKTTFDHDKKLVDYFTQQKDAEKSKLVTERLPLILKETEELMKQMPK